MFVDRSLMPGEEEDCLTYFNAAHARKKAEKVKGTLVQAAIDIIIRGIESAAGFGYFQFFYRYSSNTAYLQDEASIKPVAKELEQRGFKVFFSADANGPYMKVTW